MSNPAELDREVSSRLRIRGWKNPRGQRFVGGPSAHAGVEVAWPDEGRLLYSVGQRRIEVAYGGAVVIPAQTEHTTILDGETRAGSLWLSSETVIEVADAMAPGTQIARLLPSLVRGGERIARIGNLLREEAAVARPGDLLAIDALAEALTVELLRDAPATPAGPTTRDARILRAIDCVQARYAEPLTVEEMAAAATMSRFHFSRRFQEQVGKSPYRFLLETRAARAAELLRSGRYRVTEAALTVGFTDLGRFGRIFRECYGVKPSEYCGSRGSRVEGREFPSDGNGSDSRRA